PPSRTGRAGTCRPLGTAAGYRPGGPLRLLRSGRIPSRVRAADRAPPANHSRKGLSRRGVSHAHAIDHGIRLYAVLIPGLLLGLAWGSLRIAYCNGGGTYSSPLIPFGDTIVVEALRP